MANVNADYKTILDSASNIRPLSSDINTKMNNIYSEFNNFFFLNGPYNSFYPITNGTKVANGTKVYSNIFMNTTEVVKICNKHNIRIIRLGLQSTDEITKNNKEIVGPVSDNLAEYVFALLVKEKLEKIIQEKNLKNTVIKVEVDKRYISIVSGPKKSNKVYFKEKYDIDLILKGV